MDLEENIRIAAEVYSKQKHPQLGLNEDWKNDGFDEGYNAAAYHKVNNAFIDGAKSQAAKDYWYNIFKNGDHIVNGKAPHYPHGIIQSDPLYGATQKDFDNVKPKNVGIIGHVEHGKPMVIVLNDSWDVARQALNKIESIVPIADVIPEPIISKQELSKQEFLLMHDKAMERSIIEETYKESRAWDIKKEKKVSHKRTNKRK